jgi:predicted ArsR family transcriptional regulator
MSDEFVASDAEVLDLLRGSAAATVADLAESLQVTPTAVRQRLMRLMAQGYVVRTKVKAGRGRPSHRYSLTSKGARKAGANFADLAIVLWQEIGALPEGELKRVMMERISKRLAEMYAGAVHGSTVEEKMESLAGLFEQRSIPLRVQSQDAGPMLTVLACPYPDLAERDRSVCSMERNLFTEVLGADVHLDSCRLDGGNCCNFATGSVAGD